MASDLVNSFVRGVSGLAFCFRYIQWPRLYTAAALCEANTSPLLSLSGPAGGEPGPRADRGPGARGAAAAAAVFLRSAELFVNTRLYFLDQ